jgi:succinylglutamate desuccinylase
MSSAKSDLQNTHPPLHRMTALPAEILQLPAHHLHRELPGPTLVTLEGEQQAPLFLSVLLHGNEDTGWRVVQNLLAQYRERKLPRSILLFIGNVRAARYRKRKLQAQPDFNRIWDGGSEPEAKVIDAVVHEAKKASLFASIDIHNNSGLNPHYACINRLTPAFLAMARRFSRAVVYFVRPRGVQSITFSAFCPSVTLECGKPGDEYGVQRATRYVDEILNLAQMPDTAPRAQDLDLFHTVATVRIPQERSISFDGSAAEVAFIAGLETLNFEEIPPDTVIATLAAGFSDENPPLHVYAESGEDIFAQVFRCENGTLISNRALIPSMLTTTIPIVKQDCLCYLMEPYRTAWGEKTVHDSGHAWREGR